MKSPLTASDASESATAESVDLAVLRVPSWHHDITSLAAHVCGKPMALLLGRDESGAALLHAHGASVSDAGALGDLVMRSGGLLVVPDAREDARFAGDPLVTHWPGVRFLAGIPLTGKDGKVSGALCVMDQRPGTITAREERAFLSVARMAPTLEPRSVSWESAPLRETQAAAGGVSLADIITQCLPGVFFIFDSSGRLLHWNRNLEQTTGFSASEIAAMRAHDLFSKPGREAVDAWIETVFSKAEAETELLLASRSGGGVPHLLRGAAVSIQGARCVIGLGTDITQQKRAEHRHESLSKLGQNLSSATTPEEAARIIGDIADELFGWDSCAVNLYPEGQVFPILNMDIIDGKRCNLDQLEIPSRLSKRGARIMKHGAELFLVNQPTGFAPEAKAFGDMSRPSAAIMMAPIRNRTSAVGILSFQSYTPNAYDQEDLSALQTLADHCGGALERIRVEQELKSSEMRFHLVWENSVDGMRLTDEKGMIVAVNNAFCQLVALSAAELVGRPFTVTYAETENLDQILNKYQQRFEGRSVEQMIERKLTFRSGKTVDLQVANSFIELPGGKWLVLGLFRDTTEHKRAEEELKRSEAQLRLLWENSLDGMRLLNEDGIFMMVNEAFCKMVEKPREELLGRSLAVIYAADVGQEILRKHCERFKNRLIAPQVEREVSLWNGKQIFVQLSNSLLEVEGRPDMLLSAVRDITVNKRVQRRIQLLEQQRALERERDRIARDMHDDVGGSLTRITLLSEIAEAEIASSRNTVTEETRQRIKRISTMSRELVRNIDEIVWAVDPGNDSLERFASYLCHMTEESLKATSINCRLDVPTMLPNCFLGSDLRHNLLLVVKESLNNSIKHSGATEISLQLGVTGSNLTIVIADNGKGFETGETRPFSNGLTNMRLRMEKAGGKLQMESRPGLGTTSRVSINLELEPEA